MVRIEVGSGCEEPNATTRTDHDDRQDDSEALVEKGSDDDLLREMIGFVANRMMDMEVEGLTGVSPITLGVPPGMNAPRPE